MTPIVYLDMDGVISDIEHGIQERYGFIDMENERSKFFKDFLPGYVTAGGFEHERVCENAEYLVNSLYAMAQDHIINLAILTSAGQFYEPMSEVVFQKKKFIEKNFPVLINVPFCVTSSGREKCFLAHKGAMLIDDHLKNIEKFNEAGGWGFHYRPERVEIALDEARMFVESHRLFKAA